VKMPIVLTLCQENWGEVHNPVFYFIIIHREEHAYRPIIVVLRLLPT
jgi:hypothetical protein